MAGLAFGGVAGATPITRSSAKKACPPCKKRKKGKCKKTLPDGAACSGGNCQAGKCVAFTPCPDGRPVCGNGACCSPDRNCINSGLGFVCACPAGTAGCSGSRFCLDIDGCFENLTACTCDGACQDGRPLCDGECCPPTQVCQSGTTCACPAGTVECQPGFCASVTCTNGQSRNPMTCVCPE